MGKKEEKAIMGPEQRTQTKVGYIPILRGEAFGSRTLDEDNTPSIFETREECEDLFVVGEEKCIAIAEVTWKEAA